MLSIEISLAAKPHEVIHDQYNPEEAVTGDELDLIESIN